MSPTVKRYQRFRFFFFSREEERKHVHVESPEGEAKFWLEPTVELAMNQGIRPQDITIIKDFIGLAVKFYQRIVLSLSFLRRQESRRKGLNLFL